MNGTALNRVEPRIDIRLCKGEGIDTAVFCCHTFREKSMSENS